MSAPSATTIANVTAAAAAEVGTASEKPVRRVVAKRVPKTAAANAEVATQAVTAPVAAVGEAVAAAETAAAPATRKRAPRKAKATTVAAAPESETANAAAPADATTSAEAAEAVAADAAGDAAAAAPAKRVRIVRPPREFISAYGDLTVDEKERSFSKEEFESWKTKTLYAVQNIRFKEWAVMKRKYYQTSKKQAKGKKRISKGYNWEATAENHLQRLKDMPAEKFKDLKDVWLSNYQFTGKFDAEQLTKDGCPERGAIPTFTVYLAAIFHGYQPAGIVSENGTRNGTEISFTTTVDGKREYVGVALPFQNKERSQYSVLPKDRVPAASATA